MSSMPNSNLIAAAVGATIGVISVATVFIYQKVIEKQQHSIVNSNIDRVNRKVTELKAELEDLRKNAEGIVSAELLEIDTDSENRSLHLVLIQKLENLLQDNPTDVEVTWRFARSSYFCYDQTKDPERQKVYIFEGCNTCEKLLNVKNGNLYKWYAILVGVKSKFLPTRGKIENGYLFKKYVDKALEISPNDSFLHHLMGRFNYEVSELSWIERKVASALFAEIPNAAYEDAIPFFENAEKLSKTPHYANKLLLGKSYIAIGRYRDGVKWLNQIYENPSSADDESKIVNEAKKLLDKYSDYCT